MFILIILAESAALVYLYKEYRSQRLTTVAVQDTLTRTRETIQALQKGIAEKAEAISDMERRLEETAATQRSIRGEQDAAYLRKRLKESKEMELQMYERIEELSRKQAGMETHAARPDLKTAAPTPAATATVAAVAQPSPTPTATATSTPIPEAADTPIAQESPPVETPPAGEIMGKILIMNETYNFIIVDVGGDDGIEAGDEGIVEHDGAQIGRAQVKKLYDKMCLADIVEASPEAKIQKNYLVKFSREPENRVQ
jgi:hypothetical protein